MTLRKIANFTSDRVYVWGIVAFVVWIAAGAFPLVSYESDSLRMAAGCEVSYHHGWEVSPALSYDYNMQPLTHHAIVALRHACPWLTCEQLYSVLTIVCAILFLVGSVELLRRVMPDVARPWLLMACLLIPESYAIALYPNSAIPAGACMVWGLVAWAGDRRWWALALLAIAPLFRIDVLLVYPAVFLLDVYRGKPLRTALLRSVTLAVGIVMALVALYGLLAANPFEKVAGYGYWNEHTPLSSVILSVFTFYSPVYCVLLPLGLWLVCRDRRWRMLLLVIVPLVMVHWFYRSMGNAPKRYLYLLPFAVMAGVMALRWLFAKERSRVLRWTAAAALTALMIVAVRMAVPGKPWLNEAYSSMRLGPVCEVVSLPHGVTVGVGAGQPLPSADERMLLTGNVFYPLHIAAVKRWQDAQLYNECAALDTVRGDYTLLTLSWKDSNHYPGRLIAQGASYVKGEEKDYDLKRGDQRIKVLLREYGTGSAGLADTRAELEQQSRQATTPVYVATAVEAHRHILDQLVAPNLLRKLNDNVYQVIPDASVGR